MLIYKGLSYKVIIAKHLVLLAYSAVKKSLAKLAHYPAN